ncbi:MAG: hypothetical protein ACM33B_07580 [Pseudomonadota bacterium]
MPSVTEAFLARERGTIVDAAEAALARVTTRHYGAEGREEVRRRLELLFDRVATAVADRDLEPVVDYARAVAEDRFAAGYDLSEVQTAFNVLEEATWLRVFAELPPDAYAEALGLVSTVLGAAKDALAQRYVSLASDAHAPALDLRALFAGRDGA